MLGAACHVIGMHAIAVSRVNMTRIKYQLSHCAGVQVCTRESARMPSFMLEQTCMPSHAVLSDVFRMIRVCARHCSRGLASVL